MLELARDELPNARALFDQKRVIAVVLVSHHHFVDDLFLHDARQSCLARARVDEKLYVIATQLPHCDFYC